MQSFYSHCLSPAAAITGTEKRSILACAGPRGAFFCFLSLLVLSFCLPLRLSCSPSIFNVREGLDSRAFGQPCYVVCKERTARVHIDTHRNARSRVICLNCGDCHGVGDCQVCQCCCCLSGSPLSLSGLQSRAITVSAWSSI